MVHAGGYSFKFIPLDGDITDLFRAYSVKCVATSELIP